MFVSLGLFTLVIFLTVSKWKLSLKVARLPYVIVLQDVWKGGREHFSRIKWRRLNPRMVNLVWFRSLG